MSKPIHPKMSKPLHPQTTSPKEAHYGLKAQTQDGEQKGPEAWAGPWAQPPQDDPWTSRTSTLSRKAGKFPDVAYIFRSTSPSRPNNIRGGLKCLSVGTYVRPSTKLFSDFNEIWCADIGRSVMHDGMPYDPIQGQGHGHGASEVPKVALSQVYLLLANNH